MPGAAHSTFSLKSSIVFLGLRTDEGISSRITGNRNLLRSILTDSYLQVASRRELIADISAGMPVRGVNPTRFGGMKHVLEVNRIAKFGSSLFELFNL